MIRSTTTAAALLAASLLTLAQTPTSAAFITTTFVGGNGGAAGRGVFFDIDVGPNDLTILGMATNVDDASGTPVSGLAIYTRLGTAQGAEQSSAGWTLTANGTITPSGEGNPSPVALDSPIMLEADTLYGFGLVFPMAFNYTNAAGCTGGNYSLSGNCFASNADLTLLLGSARNPPFESGSVQERIFNGTIEYEVAEAPLPGTLALLALGLAGIRLVRRRS